jgi:hypothetical protein
MPAVAHVLRIAAHCIFDAFALYAHLARHVWIVTSQVAEYYFSVPHGFAAVSVVFFFDFIPRAEQSRTMLFTI